MSNTIGHNGTTGWVVSRRRDELAAKRGARQVARREAWAEVADMVSEAEAKVARIAAEVEACWADLAMGDANPRD